MDSLRFFKNLLSREDAADCVLCTIIAEEGSVPRKSGTQMAVFPDGSFLGTVGGGAVEHMAGQYAKSLCTRQDAYTEVRHYGLDGQQRENITGMICGGALSILFQKMDRRSLEHLSPLKTLRAGTQSLYLLMPLPDGAAGAASEPLILCGEEELPDGVRLQRKKQPVLQGQLFVAPVALRGMVYLFGAGHVGRALFGILRSTGFPVVVVDDRPAMLEDPSFDDAERKICMPYHAFPEALPISADDYLVVCTSGHGGDVDVLLQMLPHQPLYAGCIGSKKKAAAVAQKLLEAGLDEALVARIHSPIGLKIKAKTPEEIAVSIAAEMILCRAEATEAE
ncbi:MAG: XdhC family protein [Lachnospiraceae bacterium]|nr:XdhC family protein [Lachnospiraceae bacterium]